MDLTEYIRTVPDFPEPGIMFRDVTTLFAEPRAFKSMIEQFNQRFNGVDIDYIGGIDARGFIIGAALAFTRASVSYQFGKKANCHMTQSRKIMHLNMVRQR